MWWQYLIIFFVLFIISLVVVKLNKKNFTYEINKLVQYLGGKDNIIDTEVNMSRLVVTLKDVTLADKEAIQKLGFERIKELRYSITKIKEELLKLKGVSLETKIFTLLKSNNKISDGIFISSSDLKNIFNKVYNSLNVKKTAKATDILDYYEVKETKHQINGKSTRGYVIIKPKIIIK